MRALLRRVIAMTVAGVVVGGFGGRACWTASWRGPVGISAGVAMIVPAMLTSSTAAAAVAKKVPIKKPSRPKVAPAKPRATVKKAAQTSENKAKSKRPKAKSPVVGTSAAKPGKKTGGRCEPQSLTYARQRSGIMRSRTGSENGPLTWFASERALGKTSGVPQPGSVLILGSDRGHGMGTGHVAYVEDAYANGPSTYRVVFSHTNYDRRCSLETNIEARYDSSKMTLDIFSGAWQPWGKQLKVAGFIAE